ncbi:hypothetical protein [Caballeronia glebae]|uniref:hypothetical protein n=1 Tax=Caballeronia glebae TaxID=1777143 RepID=UPI0038BA8733
MLKFKRFQTSIISTYRITMTGLLFVIVAGVLSYLFLMVFYAVNGNWAAPVLLSPTQEKVLAFQPQIATLEATLLKNRVDLATAKQKSSVLTEQIAETTALIKRFDTAGVAESKAQAENAVTMQRVLAEKRADIDRLKKTLRETNLLRDSIASDLAAGLITKDEAASRRLSLETSAGSLTDGRITAVSLNEQAREASAVGKTLADSASTSLIALQSLNNVAQLNALRAQAVVDAETAKQSVAQLSKSVAESERVLNIAKRSPYYAALHHPVAVVFVQYSNMSSVRSGEPVFDCFLQVFLCRKVGVVDQAYDAEQYARHPLFKTDIKGKFVGVTFSATTSSESPIVFVGYKPLLF